MSEIIFLLLFYIFSIIGYAFIGKWFNIRQPKWERIPIYFMFFPLINFILTFFMLIHRTTQWLYDLELKDKFIKIYKNSYDNLKIEKFKKWFYNEKEL